jgi:hypothetical protein
MCGSAEEIVQESDVVVVSHRDEGFKRALAGLKGGQTLIDLVRIADGNVWPGCEYYGICW